MVGLLLTDTAGELLAGATLLSSGAIFEAPEGAGLPLLDGAMATVVTWEFAVSDCALDALLPGLFCRSFWPIREGRGEEVGPVPDAVGETLTMLMGTVVAGAGELLTAAGRLTVLKAGSLDAAGKRLPPDGAILPAVEAIFEAADGTGLVSLVAPAVLFAAGPFVVGTMIPALARFDSTCA
jgi:hypothetical protein